MIEIRSSAGLIYHPRMQDTCAVLSAGLSLELNKAGSLTFTLPPNHPRGDMLKKLATECWVLRDGEELFRGRVLYSDRDLSGCRDVCCEGLRNVLNDEALRPADLSANGTYSGTAAGLIALCCAAYNARHTGEVQFVCGTVDDFGTVTANAADYPGIGDFLDKTVQQYGGYLSVRRVNGFNRIDYTVSSGGLNGQTIRFGENLLDLQEHVTGEDVYTEVIPLGKDMGEGRGRLTITESQYSGGMDYIENPTAITLLGVRIAKVVTFDEIEDPDELYAAGAAFLNAGGGLTASVTLSAVDLHLADVNISALRLGEYNRMYAPNFDPYMLPLTKCNMDLLDAENDSYSFGVTMTTLSEKQANQNKKAGGVSRTAETALQTASAAMRTATAAATPAQVSAAIAASEGRVGDYITEVSVSGDWTVRKWSSGLIEAACRVTAEIASGSMVAWGGVYVYSGTKAYPTGLFTAAPELHAAVIGGSMGAWCGMAAPSNNTKDAAAYSLIAPAQTTAAQTCVITLMARGY